MHKLKSPAGYLRCRCATCASLPETRCCQPLDPPPRACPPRRLLLKHTKTDHPTVRGSGGGGLWSLEVEAPNMTGYGVGRHYYDHHRPRLPTVAIALMKQWISVNWSSTWSILYLSVAGEPAKFSKKSVVLVDACVPLAVKLTSWVQSICSFDTSPVRACGHQNQCSSWNLIPEIDAESAFFNEFL